MGKNLLILLLIFYSACRVEAQHIGNASYKSNKSLYIINLAAQDSSFQTEYIYKFNASRVLGETAGGIGLGFVGMLAGSLLGKGLSFGETGAFAGFAQVIIGGYLGYLAGAAGGVTLVAHQYNSDVTFLSNFAASASGAVAGILLVDWRKGGDWRASFPFIMPLVFSVISSELFYPSRVTVTVDQDFIPYQTIQSQRLSINFRIPIN